MKTFSSHLLRSINLIMLVFGSAQAIDNIVITGSPDYSFLTQFRAQIFKPSASNMHYAAEAIALPLISPNWNIYDIKTKYHFGFDLGFGAFLHDSDSNLYANWQHFHSNDSSCVTVATSDMVGPFFEIGPDASAYTSARGNAQFTFNEANLLYGQNVNIGDNLDTSLFAGITITQIKQQVTSFYANTDATITRTITTPIKYIGAGPAIGVNYFYTARRLFLAGRTSASLLSGTMKNSTCYAATSPFLTELGASSPNFQSTSVNNRTVIVPVFVQRLGVAYKPDICEDYSLRFEVGYQAQIYFNALQSIDLGSEVITPPVIPSTVGVYARTFQRNISNFALSGPYVAISFGF